MATRKKIPLIPTDATLTIGSSKTLSTSVNLDISGADVTIVGNGTNVVTFPARSLTVDNITTSTTTNGTGFLKGNGSVISFDNSTYLTSLSGALLATGATTGATSQSQTFTNGITLSNLTASELVATDASKNLQSLAVATYPSLTEISYVKGVTSAIQTQLNAKGVGDMLLGTVQSVTAEKKFTKDKLTMLGTSTGKLIISNALTNGTNYTVTFPAKTGTVAMTSDIVSQVEDSIVDGHTTIAPSGNAVFDALALKAPLTSPTFATSINGSYLTASQILGTDASKNIVSLPVATYPSLTELSYVKGVTSAIQTQISGKIPNSLVDAKGDLIVGSAADTPARLAVGSNGYIPRANSGATNGIEWTPPYNSLAYQCLINGGFTVNQRTYVSNATLAAGAYGHDRWKAGASGGDYTFTQLAQATTITIKTGKSLIQVIEDKNVIGGTYTLSWTGTAQARFGINSATPSGAYAASPITITTQTAGTVMSVEFNEGTLGQVNCANSSVALPFMPKSFEEELRACQRYYQVGGAGACGTFESTTKVSLGFTLSNNMRIAPGVALNTTSPVVSEHGIGDRTATSSTYTQIFSTINALAFTADGFSGATAGKGCTMKNNYLNISAEL